MRVFLGAALFLLSVSAMASPPAPPLDTMDSVSAWPAEGSDGVTAHAEPVAGHQGQAVRMAYDFGKVSGYAFLRKDVALPLPENFELRFRIRGTGGANDLQIKLTDGDTVWWKPWVNYRAPATWTEVVIPAGDIIFAWGPDAAATLTRADGIEFVVARNRDGGAGTIEIDDLRLIPLPGRPVRTLAAKDDPNAALAALAQTRPRGDYPRAFMGEQPYWTLAGSDGGAVTALISEDGAIEPAKGSFSFEPFLIEGARRLSWSDATITQSLADGYLPIPSVEWRADDWQLQTTLLVDAQGAGLRTGYRLTNRSAETRRITLALAARPLQVNPPAQFLAQRGGIALVDRIAATTGGMTIDWRADKDAAAQSSVVTSDTPADALSGAPDMRLADPLGTALSPPAARLTSPDGMATAALHYDWTLAPGESRFVSLAVTTPDAPPIADWDALYARTADHWRATLNQVKITVPADKARFANSTRTALAHMLVSRDGPMLKPGTRSYNRAWIRDGAMMGEGLLRMGRADVAREFATWYQQHLFANGKVPCCVDFRGADPVPENDSHGELIFLVAQLYRHTGDRAALERDWPAVLGAYRYMESLRQSERTPANQTPERLMLYGLMPPSISHEGYSAKAQYSLWDDFWALRGYKDAAWLADILGDPAAPQIHAACDEFAADLHRAIAASQKHWGIDFIPGATSLGDFDATSTTIALDPGGEQARLDAASLDATFERYWTEFVARRDGTKAWKDYTPYELRTVSAFTRLGWRERVQQLLAYFFDDQRPSAWNGWAEVVGRNPREIRFIGDMPHAWVASDYLRGALDMFAYDDHAARALVIGGGFTPDWLAGNGSGISGLVTPYGPLDLQIAGDARSLRLTLGGAANPPGGFRFDWPFAGILPKVKINGRSAKWSGKSLIIPATGRPVTIRMGR